MKTTCKWIIVALLVIAAAFAWMTRYSYQPNSTGGVMRMDRWTGEVTVCVPIRGCI
jgi:hypothetical protein